MEIIKTDLLIVGGGLSAYMAASTLLKKRKKDQIMLVSACQGGQEDHEIAGLSLPRMNGDSVEQFYEDTRKAGFYQNDPALVRLVCEESEAVFDRARTVAQFAPPEEGSRFRPLTSNNDLIKAMEESFGKHVEKRDGSHCLRLLVKDSRIQGALCYDRIHNVFFAVSTGTVLLAVGGYGELYGTNANNSVRSGDGIGLAYYAGAKMADLEFVYFPEDRKNQEAVSLGGIVIDNQCRTSVPGLLACGGAVAGVHGAGLLPGNAEMAALVLGRRAAHTLIRMDFEPGADEDTLFDWVQNMIFAGHHDQREEMRRIRKEIERILNECAGPVRFKEKIEEGLQAIAHMQHEFNDMDLCRLPQLYEKMRTECMLITARLILLSSLEREESKGCYQIGVKKLVEVTKEPEPELEETAENTSDDSQEQEGESDEAPKPVQETASASSEPVYTETVELIEKAVKPYRVVLQMTNNLLLPEKEDWSGMVP